MVVLTLVLALLTIPLFAADKPAKSQQATTRMQQQQLAQMPLVFAPNMGQANPAVRYVAHGAGYGVALTDGGTRLALPKAGELRLNFEGAKTAKIAAADQQKTKFNYYLGSDRSKWRTNVPSYGRVNYTGLYAGIDAAFYGTNGRLEHDFIVAPGADASQIRIAIEGAKNLKIDGSGNLVMATSDQNVEMLKPVVYQEIAGQRKLVAASYKLAKNQVTFELGAYDKSRELVIDPVVLYGTMVGGTYATAGTQLAYDQASSMLYVAGTVTGFAGSSFGFGTATNQGLGGNDDLFFAQLADSGNATAYSWVTLVGGGGAEALAHLKFSHSALLAVGSTYSAGDYPTTGNAMLASGGTQNRIGYITVLDNTGALSYSSVIASTLLNSNNDATAFDTDGTFYYVGAVSDDVAAWPTSVGPCSANCVGTANAAVLLKLDPTQTGAAQIVDDTYVDSGAPSPTPTTIRDLAVATGPIVHMAVESNGVDGANLGCGASGKPGVSLVYFDYAQSGCLRFTSAATFGTATLGGAATTATALHYDFNVREYIVGYTQAADTSAAETLTGGQDAYVAFFVGGALNTAHLITGASSAVGTLGTADVANAVDSDSNGSVYVVGSTDASDLRQVNDGTSSTASGAGDGFIAIYDNTFALQFQRYVGKSAKTTTLTGVAAANPVTAGEYVGFFGGATNASHVATTATSLQTDNSTGGTQALVFKAAVNPAVDSFAGSSVGSGSAIVYGISGGTIYNASGTVVSSFTLPISLAAAGTVDHVTIDAANPTDGSAATTPLGLLTGGTGCFNAAANTPGGVTCHEGTITSTPVAADLTFTPATISECDEATGPVSGACPGLSYNFWVYPSFAGAQSGAFLNGASYPFTVVPVTDVKATWTVASATYQLGAPVSHVANITNAGGHTAPSVAVTFAIPGTPTFTVGAVTTSTTGAATVNCAAFPSCTITNLAAGEVATITIPGSYDTTNVIAGGSVNPVTWAGTGANGSNYIDINGGNDTGVTNDTVQRQADVSLTAGAFPATAVLGAAGQTYNWTLTDAAGSNTVPTTTVTFTFPTDFNITSYPAPAGWACGSAGTTFTCTITNLAASASANFAVTGNYIDAAASAIGTQTPTATVVLTNTINTTVGSTTVNEATTVERNVDWSTGGWTSGPSFAYLGQTPITYATAGTSGATSNVAPINNLVVTFNVDSSFVIASAAPTAGTAQAAFTCVFSNVAHTATCTNTAATVAPNGTATFTITGSYTDSPTQALFAAQVFAVVSTGPAITANTTGSSLTNSTSTTLNRVINAAVAPNPAYPTGPVTLGAATTYATDVTTTVTPGTTDQVPANALTLTITVPTNFTPSAGVTAPAGWSCGAFAASVSTCTNTAAITATTTGNFSVAGSYNDDPTNAPTAVQGSQFHTALTFNASITSNTAGTTTSLAATTLNRISTLTVSAPAGINVQLGVATTLSTTLTWSGNKLPIGYGVVTFVPDAGFTTAATPVTTADANWTCTGLTCTNTAGPVTASGAVFVLHGSYADDPARNLGTLASTGADVNKTAAASGDATFTASGWTTAALNGTYTLNRVLNVTTAATPSYPTGPITLGTAANTTYGSTVTVTVVAGVDNQVPSGAATFTFNVPSNFTLNPAGLTAAAPFTCTGGPTTFTCSNTTAITTSGTYTVTGVGTYNDDPTNVNTPVVQGGQYAATENQVVLATYPNTSITSVTPAITAATTLQRNVNFAFTSAAITDSTGGTTTLNNPMTYTASVAVAAGSNTAPLNSLTGSWTLPKDFKITAVTPSGASAAAFTCTFTDNSPAATSPASCVNSAGTVAAGGAATFTISGYYIDNAVDPLTSGTVTGAITTSAAITNNTTVGPLADSATTILQREVSWTYGAMTAPATAVLGSQASPAGAVTYAITLTAAAAGPTSNTAPINNATLTYTAPANFNITGASITGGTAAAAFTCAAPSGGAVSCINSAGTFPPAGTVTVQLAGNFIDTATDPLAVATITASAAKGANITTLTGYAPVNGTTTPLRDIALSAAATSSLPSPYIGQSFTYTYTVSNAGPDQTASPALDPNAVVVAVTVPADFVVSGTPTAGWTCTQAGLVVTCKTSGTTVIAAGGNSTFDIVGSYKDSAVFATATTNQTLTATITVATPNACTATTAPCEINAGTPVPNFTIPIQREVALTTSIAQADLGTSSTTQVGVTDAFHYYVTVTNSGPDDATAPTITGTTTVTIPVDANFTATSAGYSATHPIANALDTVSCTLGHPVVCTFNNLVANTPETIDVLGTYAPTAVMATGSATTTTTASATDSLAVVTNAASTGSTISTLTMDTPLNGGLPITPYFNFTPTLTAKYPLVTTSGITTDAVAGAFAGRTVADTYTTGALAIVFPTGTTHTYASPAGTSHTFSITNGLAGTQPDLCGAFTGASFVKPERVRLWSGASSTDLTNVLAACAFGTGGQVHGTLSDWTSGSNYSSTLSFIEPVNRNPVILTQIQAAAALGLTQTGNTVTFDASKIFGDPDINQPCFGSATSTCDDVLTIKIAFTNATLISPSASGGVITVAAGSVTETSFPGNGPLALSISGAVTNFQFNTPANSTSTFTLTATDQVGGTATQTYTVVNGGGGGTTPPATIQTVNAGGTAVFQVPDPNAAAGVALAGGTITCGGFTIGMEGSAYYGGHSIVNGHIVASGSTPMPSTSDLAGAHITCSASGTTLIIVTSGQVISSMHPAPLPNSPAGNDTALLAAVYALGGLPIFGVLLLRSKNRKLVRMIVLAWILVAAVLMMVGCGGGGFQASPQQHIGSATTPTGTYYLNVTGASGTSDYAVIVQ